MEYDTNQNSLSPDEVTMKEEIQSLFQRLGYEVEFSPNEAPSTDVRKRRIDNHVILSAINLEKSRKNFGKHRVFMFFFMTCMFPFFI